MNEATIRNLTLEEKLRIGLVPDAFKADVEEILDIQDDRKEWENKEYKLEIELEEAQDSLSEAEMKAEDAESTAEDLRDEVKQLELFVQILEREKEELATKITDLEYLLSTYTGSEP